MREAKSWQAINVIIHTTISKMNIDLQH
jgi:hypothetical protein